MRELTVRIRFTAPCLGNQKLRDGSGRFVFSKNEDSGQVIFLPAWHQANMRLAAQLLGRHQQEVTRIHWDQHVDGRLRKEKWFKRHYGDNRPGSRSRFVLHEAFFPGQEVGINLCLPARISEDDFLALMRKAGQYQGLSPWKPGEFGFFEVVSLRERQMPDPPDDGGRYQQRQLDAESTLRSENLKT